MIRRVLVANRGEIAVRIIRACRELGLETVAVHSTADVQSPHVGLADTAVEVGPAPASESYLAVSKVVDAARRSGADAVHPGYGFLAENAEFAAACADAGLVFVGPPAAVIARMGSKVAARALMERAGVPTVPGATPPDQTVAGITAAADQVGYPLLLKASAGGGGKGMRLVGARTSLEEAVASARREAVAAFGDGTLYVERLIEHPRHVEFQVMADAAGRIVHLFERECSVQRRHQKIVEESPSVALTPRLRARMGEAAVAAARAAGYVNAGTVEFLLDGSGDDARFYFLEMNTRLQVEHPVTEVVTGVDLVRTQLAVAGGAPLPWRQDQLTQRGHAVECRIYAEDPEAGFLPQAGRLLLYREPSGPGVRVDAGVVEGGEVPVHYDPLIAKLIAGAETRLAAIERAAAALARYPVLGVRTNVAFLGRVLGHAAFRDGGVDTGFVQRELPALLAAPPTATVHLAMAAAASVAGTVAGPALSHVHRPDTADPWRSLGRWRRPC